MAALLEIKQKIKNFYGTYEFYILPFLKFLLAFGYFQWISRTLNFSAALENIFVLLILSLLCAILPTNSIIYIGFILMIGQCYALSMEVAAFALILIILMMILFLRFSPSANLAMIFAPMGFSFQIPMLVPVGSGLLGNPLTVAPAACGVILNYFISTVRGQSAALADSDRDITQKLKLVLDGMVKNQTMWITLVAFVIVILLVYLLRTRSMDFAWRIAIVVGIITYVVVMVAGGLFMEADVSMVSLFVTAVISLVLGLALEFFAFGGDYSRTEHLEYEDDDYYYYVKAVPKASISTSERQIKKINKRPGRYEENAPAQEENSQGEPVLSDSIVLTENNVDFEKKLEESLRDL